MQLLVHLGHRSNTWTYWTNHTPNPNTHKHTNTHAHTHLRVRALASFQPFYDVTWWRVLSDPCLCVPQVLLWQQHLEHWPPVLVGETPADHTCSGSGQLQHKHTLPSSDTSLWAELHPDLQWENITWEFLSLLPLPFKPSFLLSALMRALTSLPAD